MGNDIPPNMVRKLRRWHDLSQAELADAVGVTRQTIANIERGNYSPSVHLALAICRVLGNSVEEVFGQQHSDKAPTPSTSKEA
ncbi:helix-turn-helix transcriptional regulator [Corynebacterium sp. TAE3-ERU12]|uniref:helix-turn-helix transcriptional regulator n=1 Tax=Corynebacterium sp. TAE3-ERU12 TaxID=2849491 RepID=UPI001C481FA1|nr:helix-turn-helix transcriptional regulator [Corynebacterium sp. TAE3-ERU12]MBV7294636.1 helix-turn-helix transcriptional regulator [Corynebacterium sp. TAE3-ERU12]